MPCTCGDLYCASCGPLHDPQRLIGLTRAEAERRCMDAGRSCRVTCIDDKPLVVTRDYVADRFNFHLRAGKVERIYVG